MARSMSPNSASSQFFICYGDAAFLDGQYAAFGMVVDGMESVDRFLETKRVGPEGGTPRCAHYHQQNELYGLMTDFNISVPPQVQAVVERLNQPRFFGVCRGRLRQRQSFGNRAQGLGYCRLGDCLRDKKCFSRLCGY